MRGVWKWFKVGYIFVLVVMTVTTLLVVLSTFESTTALSFYGKLAGRVWETMPVSPALIALAQGGGLALFVWAKGKRREVLQGKGNASAAGLQPLEDGSPGEDLPFPRDAPEEGRPDEFGEVGGKSLPHPKKVFGILLSDWILIGLIVVVVGFGLLSSNPTTPPQAVQLAPAGHTVADFLVNNTIVLLVLAGALAAGLWYLKMAYEARSTARFLLPVNVGGKAMPIVIDMGITFYRDLGKVFNYLRLVLGRRGKKTQDILKDVQVIDAPDTEAAVWVIYVISSLVGRAVAQGRFTLENILELEEIEDAIRDLLARETRLSAYGLMVETVVVRDISFPREVGEAQAKKSAAEMEGESWAGTVNAYIKSLTGPDGVIDPKVALGVKLAVPIISALGNIAETLVGGRKGDSQ